MTSDFENASSIGDLGDDDLRDLVRQELAESPLIDSDSILVQVKKGLVTLSGRIGTEEERRVAEHVLTDVVGVSRYANNLVVDPIRRDLESEAADEDVADEADESGELLGNPPSQVTDTSEHLSEDLDARLYGTHDLRSAIERGTPWSPPDGPTPEGLAGTDPDVDAVENDEH